MFDENKLAAITSVLERGRWNLDNINSRRRLGRLIGEAIGMYDGRVQGFLEEMVGLDLLHQEDRETFLLFCRAGL